MIDLSLRQVLSLWSDLHAAQSGTASHGDTAELYVYRFMDYNPMTAAEDRSPGMLGELARESAAESYARANVAMHDLLLHFARERGVRIVVEGRYLGEWLKTAGYRHRVAVRVMAIEPVVAAAMPSEPTTAVPNVYAVRFVHDPNPYSELVEAKSGRRVSTFFVADDEHVLPIADELNDVAAARDAALAAARELLDAEETAYPEPGAFECKASVERRRVARDALRALVPVPPLPSGDPS